MVLDISHLHLHLGNAHILDDVSLSVAQSERVGIIGVSGSGKSMIAKTVLGLTAHEARISGHLYSNGEDLLTWSDSRRASLRGTFMSAVFQDPLRALNPVWTVRKNIELPLTIHYDLTASQRDERVREIIAHVDLSEDVLTRYPSQLSGGQAQRVAIAQALVASPRLLIADEPTTALDSITQAHVLHTLHDVTQRMNVAVLFISHDFSVISRMTDRTYVIDEGRIVESGDTHSIMNAPTHEYTRTLVEAARQISLESATVGNAGDMDSTSEVNV